MVGTFKVGEKVVYPAHGVGVIEGIQTKVVSGAVTAGQAYIVPEIVLNVAPTTTDVRGCRMKGGRGSTKRNRMAVNLHLDSSAVANGSGDHGSNLT